MKIKKSIVTAALACVLSVGTLFSGTCSYGVSAEWDTSGGKWYYLDEDGDKVTGFQEIDGETYYFGKDGVMKTGWIYSGDDKYYYKKDGSMAKDCTLKINGKSYKFDKDGKLKKSSSSSSSPARKNTKPKEFVMPKFGSDTKKVLSECGIANYEKSEDQGDGTTQYIGSVLLDGETAVLFVCFNENDELFAVYLYIPCSYRNYDDLVDEFVDELGDYDEKEGDSYYWLDGTEGLMLSFTETENYELAQVIIMDINYC